MLVAHSFGVAELTARTNLRTCLSSRFPPTCHQRRLERFVAHELDIRIQTALLNPSVEPSVLQFCIFRTYALTSKAFRNRISSVVVMVNDRQGLYSSFRLPDEADNLLIESAVTDDE